MNAALEILHAEREALRAALASSDSYVATCKGEIYKSLKDAAANRERLSEIEAVIRQVN